MLRVTKLNTKQDKNSGVLKGRRIVTELIGGGENTAGDTDDE